jgi:hypothetical protein
VDALQVIIGVIKLVILLAALVAIIYVSRFAFTSFRKYPIGSNLNGAAIRFRSTASLVLSNGVEIGGFLILTDKELVFISHGANVIKVKDAFPLTKIKAAETSYLNRIFPQGLKLIFKDENVFRFRVWRRKKWAALINSTV